VIAPAFPPEDAPAVPARIVRQFSALCIAISAMLLVSSWLRHGGRPSAVACTIAGLALLVGVPGLIRPAAIRPIYVAAMAVTRPIGHLVSAFSLALIYFGPLTGVAAIFRLAGRDVLRLRRPAADSYWTPVSRNSDPREYLRQYQGRRPGTPG
jgi:hypothetical protein